LAGGHYIGVEGLVEEQEFQERASKREALSSF
jgi:hypothetical protein